MTKQEKKALEISVDLWDQLCKLPIMHDDDIHEFRFHIHAIQNSIYAREGIRKDPKSTFNVDKVNP